MNNLNHRVLGLLMAGAVCLAATAPVAMRVELEPLREVGGNTEVAVVVQVAPMDRGRVGSNAIVRVELDEGRVSSGSPMRAVSIEDDGSFRIVVEWPPGEHDLRVVLEDSNREDTGLWVGKVRIPDLSPEATVQKIDEPEPEPAPVPVPEPDAAAAKSADVDGYVADSVSESPPKPFAADEAPVAAGAAVVSELPDIPDKPAELQMEKLDEPEAGARAEAEVTIPAVVQEPPPVEPEPVPVPETPQTTEPDTAIAVSELAEQLEPQPVPAPETTTSPPDEPPIDQSEVVGAEPVLGPERTEAEAEAEPMAADEIAEAEGEPPLVEPLRADPPPTTEEPETSGSSETVAPPPATVPVTAELVARYEDWESADRDTREFSLIVLRGREPAQGLDAGDLRLRVGSSETPIERLGGAADAPLLLGLAIDVMTGDTDGWSGSQGGLAPIADRARGGRGRLFVANPSGVGDWGAEPVAAGRGDETRRPMNVARLINASLENFDGVRGRTFLVVLTDGRNEPTKDEWQAATDAAGVAGVPILVVALWDGDFSQRTRKNLKKLTDTSGGSLFLVQGSSQVESAADRFGRYLDGGYALRFRPPSGALGAVTAISVTATERGLQVTAPKSIR